MLTTDTVKKNQHYLPKFYLRYFSKCEKEKEIGVYNINNKRTIRYAPIKSQASKAFYYGRDGVIEDWLSRIEGDFANVIKNLKLTMKPPKRFSDEHLTLLRFVSCTFARNPMTIENGAEMMNKIMSTMFSNKESEYYDIPHTDTQDMMRISMDQMSQLTVNILDLEIKLLVNKTDVPFIASDYPIVLYNSYLERKKWAFSKVGFGVRGLQIFIPISPDLTLTLFDSAIYKIGGRKSNYLNLTTECDILQLNTLQYLNCIQHIYFSDLFSDKHLHKLLQNSLRFPRANIVQAELLNLINETHSSSDKKRVLVRGGTSDLSINLEINGVKYLSGALSLKLDYSTPSCMRELPEQLLMERLSKRTNKPFLIYPKGENP